MCIIERIYQLIDYKKDSVYKISKEIGVSNGYFSKTKAKNGSVGGDIIEKIVNYYTDVNVEWLITGKGEMLKTSTQSIVQNGNANINNGHNVSGQGNVIKQTNNELMEIIREKDRQIAEKDKQIAMLIEKISK